MGQLQYVENPTVVVVPPPNRSGRYLPEVRTSAGPARCGHRAQQALLWLIFVEEGEESRREVSDVICSACEPARFERVARWAKALR
ncbi:MAG: hypothetical protein ACRD4U_06450 [Candidatus Acidiferrales bacterium]